jgi:hypothetical protein
LWVKIITSPDDKHRRAPHRSLLPLTVKKVDCLAGIDRLAARCWRAMQRHISSASCERVVEGGGSIGWLASTNLVPSRGPAVSWTMDMKMVDFPCLMFIFVTI